MNVHTAGMTEKIKSSTLPMTTKLKNITGRSKRKSDETPPSQSLQEQYKLFQQSTEQQPEIQIQLRNTNQIVIAHSKDAIPQQLKAKILHEEYSKHILQQDARYTHHANLER